MPSYRVNHGFDQAPEANIQLREVAHTNGAQQTHDDVATSNSYEIDDHKLPLETILKRYMTSVDRGLKADQVEKNRLKYGRNALIPPKKPSKIWEFIKCVCGGLNALLWGCAVLSFGSYASQFLYTDFVSTDNLFLGCSIVIVVHVSGSFEFYQQFKSDRILESFKNMVPHFASVTRGGKKLDVSVDDLVVGDLVEVKYGDLIPADLLIVSCSDFKVDHSSLTGESEPQKRGIAFTDENPMETKNLAFFSTNALEGIAQGIVVRTGGNTFMGKLASLATKVDSGPSPIQKEMNRFILIMTFRSLLFGSIFFILAMLMGYSTINAIFFVIGIVVANVPEGLTVTFTSMLALCAKRMAKKNCLVKNIQGVETLGSTSVICSDKTGTLTQNKMSVAHLWFNNNLGEADTDEYITTRKTFITSDTGFLALSNIALLCSNAVFKPGEEALPISKRAVKGDASETAILRYMESRVGNVAKYRQKYPKLAEIPFNSRNKYQVSIHDMRDPADPRYILVMKGAPEKIISLCTHILVGNKTHELNPFWKDEFNHIYSTLGSLGERVLGFCDARLPLDKYPIGHEFDPEDQDFLTLGFRFVGMISMIDPPRPAVPDAVARCRTAGIKVVMVTGDHPITATAIARSVGIISEGNQTIEERALAEGCSVDDIDPNEVSAAVVTGAELALLTTEQLQNVLANTSELVFARTSPEQKFRIVEGFQALGNVVAVTGDGVNDSPALKKADTGISMGISGSEVSKETADMILMDDNFTTIVTGIEEGRLIFDNIKKLICYNLADNIAEMYSVWLFIILGCPLPMGTIAMLLSVLCTDVFPAISISHEKAEADIMRLKPRDPFHDKLVTPQLLSYTYGQTSVIEVFSGFLCYFVTMGYNGFTPKLLYGLGGDWENHAINDLEDAYGQEWSYGQRQQLGLTAQTAFFVSIVFTQISNVIVCKRRRLSVFGKDILKNVFMDFAIIFELCLLAFLVYTPFVNSALNLRPLWHWEQFIPPFPFMFFMIVYDELRRLGIRVSKHGSWMHTEFYT